MVPDRCEVLKLPMRVRECLLKGPERSPIDSELIELKISEDEIARAWSCDSRSIGHGFESQL